MPTPPSHGMGPLMYRAAPGFRGGPDRLYLNVVRWADVLRGTFDKYPTPAGALFVTTILQMQARTIADIKIKLAARGGSSMVAPALRKWEIEWTQYRTRLAYYHYVVREIRAGSWEVADLHNHWFRPLFDGDYETIVGMTKVEYEKDEGLSFAFVPPRGWPPDVYTGATLFNQLAAAEGVLSPLDFQNVIAGWAREAERELSQSAPGEKETWGDLAHDTIEKIREVIKEVIPYVEPLGKGLVYGALGLVAIVGGVAIYRARNKAIQFAGVQRQLPQGTA